MLVLTPSLQQTYTKAVQTFHRSSPCCESPWATPGIPCAKRPQSIEPLDCSLCLDRWCFHPRADPCLPPVLSYSIQDLSACRQNFVASASCCRRPNWIVGPSWSVGRDSPHWKQNLSYYVAFSRRIQRRAARLVVRSDHCLMIHRLPKWDARSLQLLSYCLRKWRR